MCIYTHRDWKLQVLPRPKTADLRPISPRLLFRTRAGAGRMRRCLFGEGKSANFNPDEYILIGIEICPGERLATPLNFRYFFSCYGLQAPLCGQGFGLTFFDFLWTSPLVLVQYYGYRWVNPLFCTMKKKSKLQLAIAAFRDVGGIFTMSEALTVGIYSSWLKFASFATAKDGRFASDLAQAAIQN